MSTAQRIDVQQLIKDASITPKRVLPALLQQQKLPDNLRDPRVLCYYTNWSHRFETFGGSRNTACDSPTIA